LKFKYQYNRLIFTKILILNSLKWKFNFIKLFYLFLQNKKFLKGCSLLIEITENLNIELKIQKKLEEQYKNIVILVNN